MDVEEGAEEHQVSLAGLEEQVELGIGPSWTHCS